MVVTGRARSVGHNEPASEVMEWFMRRWSDLSETERKTAIFEVRKVDDFHMIGFKFTDDPTLTT